MNILWKYTDRVFERREAAEEEGSARKNDREWEWERGGMGRSEQTTSTWKKRMRKGERFGRTMNCIESWDIWITFHGMILLESFSASHFKYVKRIHRQPLLQQQNPHCTPAAAALVSPLSPEPPAHSAFYRFFSFRCVGGGSLISCAH